MIQTEVEFYMWPTFNFFGVNAANKSFFYTIRICLGLNRILSNTTCRPRGLMDKASDFGSEDCEFESRRGRTFAEIVYLSKSCSHQMHAFRIILVV